MVGVLRHHLQKECLSHFLLSSSTCTIAVESLRRSGRALTGLVVKSPPAADKSHLAPMLTVRRQDIIASVRIPASDVRFNHGSVKGSTQPFYDIEP